MAPTALDDGDYATACLPTTRARKLRAVLGAVVLDAFRTRRSLPGLELAGLIHQKGWEDLLDCKALGHPHVHRGTSS